MAHAPDQQKRRRFLVDSWDTTRNRGIATDGTSWGNDLIKYYIRGEDITDARLGGRLLHDEVISAVEGFDRSLVDIIVEEGPRTDILDRCKNYTPLPAEVNTDRLSTIENRLDLLEDRIRHLERAEDSAEDDGR